MNYQGKLTDAVGVAITGDHAIEFRIYDSETGGVLLWSEEHLAVTLTNGLFDIILGETTAMNLPFDEQYWIEIEIDGETLTPREKFASVAYAHRAVYADTAEYVTGGGVADDDWTRVGNIVHAYNTTDTIGIGTTSPSGGKLVVLDNTEGTGIHLEAETRTVDVVDGAFDVSLPGEALAEGEFFVEVLSGEEVVIPREPLERPMEPMAVEGLEIGKAGEYSYFSSDAVGIGTGAVEPSAQLEIYSPTGTGTVDMMRLRSKHDSASLEYSLYVCPREISYKIANGGTSTNLTLSTEGISGGSFNAGYGNILLMPHGNVGIANASPSYPLDVNRHCQSYRANYANRCGCKPRPYI
jgi:hypothetical protein